MENIWGKKKLLNQDPGYNFKDVIEINAFYVCKNKAKLLKIKKTTLLAFEWKTLELTLFPWVLVFFLPRISYYFKGEHCISFTSIFNCITYIRVPIKLLVGLRYNFDTILLINTLVVLKH